MRAAIFPHGVAAATQMPLERAQMPLESILRPERYNLSSACFPALKPPPDAARNARTLPLDTSGLHWIRVDTKRYGRRCCARGDDGGRGCNAVLRVDDTIASPRPQPLPLPLHKSCAESQIYAELRGRCVYFHQIVDKCPIYSCF